MAQRELAAGDETVAEAVCFHAQQSVEKLMKAFLIHQGIPFPRIHDLYELSLLLPTHQRSLLPEESELRFLSIGAVEARYPGESATRQEAQEAFDVCIRARTALLGLFSQ